MIFDMASPEQRHGFYEHLARHDMRYGTAFVLRLGYGHVMLIEPWLNPAAVR